MSAIKAIGILPLSAILASLTNFESSKGKLKFMEVEDTGENYFEDAGITQSNEEIAKNLVDIDDDGDFAIRYASISVTGSTKLTTSELDENQVVRSWIGKSADGKPYLRAVFQTLA